MLDLTLREVEDGKRRDWRALLHQSKATLKALEDQLARAGVLAREGRRTVAVDRGTISGVQGTVRQTLTGGANGARTDLLGAALVVLASVIPLRTVFDRRHKRQDKERVEALTRQVGDSVPRFDRLVRQMRRTRGLSYSAGGPVH